MDTKRFHKPEYKNQIRAARAYKRKPKSIPEGPLKPILSKIGIGTLFRQIILFLVVASVIYLVYFAPFLRLNNLQIAGANPPISDQVQQIFSSYISKFSLLPQKNILFFSKEKFTMYLLDHDYQISDVPTINKRFPHVLKLTLNPRVPAYLLSDQGKFYILNSDGKISIETPDPNSAGLFLINDLSNEQINLGEQVLTAQTYNFLSYLNANFSKAIGQSIDHYEIPASRQTDLTVYTKSDIKFYFDSSNDPSLYLQRLITLWNKIGPDQEKKLAYIDLRFDPNAYGCYKGQTCSQ